jgi:hypothetical protein
MSIQFPRLLVSAILVLGTLALWHLRAASYEARKADDPVSRTDASSIGIEVGSNAPAFMVLDQFGRPQSNETVKGANGTVLLFFRSADW